MYSVEEFIRQCWQYIKRTGKSEFDEDDLIKLYHECSYERRPVRRSIRETVSYSECSTHYDENDRWDQAEYKMEVH